MKDSVLACSEHAALTTSLKIHRSILQQTGDRPFTYLLRIHFHRFR
jgi:hypothetical protein